MAAFVKKLRRIMGEMPPLPDLSDSPNTQWRYSQFLKQQDTNFFRPLVKKHLSLTIEYQVLCRQLNSELMIAGADVSEFSEQIACALMMAELLEHLYRYYLAVPREQNRYARDQMIWRNLLRQHGFRFGHQRTRLQEPDTLSQKIRSTTAHTNWPRLFLIRSKRLMEALVPIFKSFESYAQFVKRMTALANPVVSYLAWLFYIPRLATNAALFIKHMIPGFGMHSKERDLGGYTRFAVYWQRHWFEVGNDTAWIVAGVLTCFVLTGVLAPAGMYLGIGLFAFDIVLAGLRAYIELGRLHKLQKEYECLEKETNSIQSPESINDVDAVRTYRLHLQERVHYEQRRMAVSLLTTTSLFLAMTMTIPLFAFSPVVPVIAASLLVLVTLVAYLAARSLEKQKPKDQIDELASLCTPSKSLQAVGFFADKSLPKTDRKVGMDTITETFATGMLPGS